MQSAAWKTILFVCFVGPGPVIGFVPWRLSHWEVHAVNPPVQGLGGLLVLLGAIPLADSIWRFVREGKGTPAPYSETNQLVITGFYRYVRNPMYLGVAAMVFGQGLALWNAGILIYGCLTILGFHIFVTFYEEPRLLRKYGPAYLAYQKQANRWLPHLTRA